MVAALTMSVVRGDYLGPSGVVVGALLVALVILDTTLVTYSRTRGGRPVLSGGRDHLTHRIVERLGTPGAVAGTLAATQFVVCSIAIAVARAGLGWVLLAGGVCVVFGMVLIWQLEHHRLGSPSVWRPPSVSDADDLVADATGLRETSSVQAEPRGKRAIAWRS
jgi:UDP-GlcNAc:undecaprenyl-phosphate GlcNAc-1-phosphate transferase